MITLDRLRDMFDQMSAREPWRVDGPLLWGYFFTDPDAAKLEPVAKVLAAEGYSVVSIYPTDDNETFFLHVEKVELHTPETLNARNLEFYSLAEQYQLESYDGMDVGPPDRGVSKPN